MRGKKVLSLLIAISLLVGILGFAAQALPGQYVTVKVSSSLNVRSAPSTSSSVLGTVKNGAVLELVSTTPNNGFYNVLYSSKSAWVSAQYCTVTVSSNTVTGCGVYIRVTASSLNVRAASNTSSAVLGQLSGGTRVELIATATENGFFKILYQGKAAYCSASYAVVDDGKKYIALTFDDGPGAHTERLLDILDSNNVKATFFLVGQNVSARSATVKRMYNAGHSVNNHTYTHPYLTKVSVSVLKDEISKTDTAIKNATGQTTTPRFLRPPYGSTNDTVKANAGKPLILWSIDTLDWQTKSADATYEAVIGSAKDGDIVLMHDIHSTTVDAVDRIIKKLKEKGFTLVTVDELFSAKGKTPSNGGSYGSVR